MENTFEFIKLVLIQSNVSRGAVEFALYVADDFKYYYYNQI